MARCPRYGLVGEIYKGKAVVRRRGSQYYIEIMDSKVAREVDRALELGYKVFIRGGSEVGAMRGEE